MIKFDMETDGKLRQFIKSKGKVINLGGYITAALLQTSETIIQETEPDVPKDTGFLRESAFARVEKYNT